MVDAYIYIYIYLHMPIYLYGLARHMGFGRRLDVRPMVVVVRASPRLDVRPMVVVVRASPAGCATELSLGEPADGGCLKVSAYGWLVARFQPPF